MAVQDFLAGDVGAVHGFVSTLVGLHDGTIQADPGKSPFAARIGQDLRIELYVRAGGGMSPHRPGRHSLEEALQVEREMVRVRAEIERMEAQMVRLANEVNISRMKKTRK